MAAKPRMKAKAAPEKKPDPGSLAARREKIRARYARPTVIFETDADRTPRYPTRFLRLNRLLGGGLKAGAIVELFGFEDSGKTSTAAALAADVQRQAPPGKRHVVFCNFEGPEPWAWWRTLGLDTSEENFTQLRPKTLEEGMADISDLLESGEVCAVIIDSVYAATAKGGREVMQVWRDPKKGGSTGGGTALEAKQWGVAWTALKGQFQDEDVVVIAVNQMREKIEMGGPPRKGWMGKATTTPRGHALKFYAWVRLEMQGRPLLDENGSLRKDVDGKTVRMKVVKNKTSEDSRGTVEAPLIRGFGFDLVGDLISMAIEAGAIKARGGGFYECGSKRLRGSDSLREWVEGSDRVQAILRNFVEKWSAKRPLPDIDAEEGGEE